MANGNKTYIDKNGYVRFIDSNKSVHRWVAEKKIGRELKPGEVVHHIDRNKRNNSPENLQVLKNQEEHDEVHRMDALEFGEKASYGRFSWAKAQEEKGGCFAFLILISTIAFALILTIII